MNETTLILLKLCRWHPRFTEVVRLISGDLRGRGLDFTLNDSTSHHPIRSDAPQSGLRPVVLNEEDTLELYRDLPYDIFLFQCALLQARELGAFLVTGEGAIDTVVSLKGSENDPKLCDTRSWRFRIAEIVGCRSVKLHQRGPHLKIWDPRWREVHENYVHVPKRGEVEANLKILGRFFH